MKKKILLSVFLILGVVLCWKNVVNAATYSGETYEIEIPDTYEVDAFARELDAYATDRNAIISITSENNTSGVLCDEEFLKILINVFEDEYPNFRLISSKVLETNACKGAQMQYRDSISGEYMYVDFCTMSSDNYIYSIIFVADDRAYLTSVQKEQIFKSFKIKDTVSSSYGLPFTDVSTTAWYRSAVKYVYQNNIIKGLNDYTFAPEQNLTRAMLVTILHRMEGSPYVSGTSKFPDVQDTNAYYYVAVKWATRNGIVSGYNNGKFGPNDPITREQLAVMLNNYCKYKGKYKATTADLSQYKDGAKVSNFAKWGMNWAVGSGVITGTKDGYLNPQGTATRAEAASMIYKYCLNVK